MLEFVCPTCGRMLANIVTSFYKAKKEIYMMNISNDTKKDKVNQVLLDMEVNTHRICCRQLLLTYEPHINIVD